MWVLMAFVVLCLGPGLAKADMAGEKQLIVRLLNNYGATSVRPDGRYGQPRLNVTVGYHLVGVTHVDRENGVVETAGYLMLSWVDSPRLKYPRGFHDVSKVRIDVNNIWTPDIALYNAAAPGLQYLLKQEMAYVYQDGTVLWVPHVSMRFLCDVARTGPFTCRIQLGSWTHAADEFNPVLDSAHLGLQEYSATRYNVLNSTATRLISRYPCCPDPYASVVYTLTLSPRHW